MQIYKRKTYINKMIPFIRKPVIKIITGMRRVGKSCFIKQIIEQLESEGVSSEDILYIDKESLDFEELRNFDDLNAMVTSRFPEKTRQRFLFIDEIQEIEGWEKAVLSFENRGDIDIFITGSNAHLLSSEFASLLSGRYIEFPIYALSFEEFLFFRDAKKESPEKEFLKFLRYGGMPAIHHFNLEEEIISQYINSIYNTILLKDVVKRHSIRNVALLENISRYLFDNIGNIFSAKKVSDYMKSQRIKVGVDTVLNYLSYFTGAMLFHRVPRYDLKGKRLLEVHDKYFPSDIGMRHALIGYREADISGILENIVFLEFKRRGYKVSLGKLGKKEIDFIATREKEKIYIQVTYLLGAQETIQREFGPLQEIRDNYPKYVLSMDTAFGDDFEGIKRLNIIDFLLH